MGLYFTASPASGQVVTEGPDSVIVPLPVADTAKADNTFFLDKWNRPAKAAFYSAVFPGGGQIYNKSYWKLPIIYGTVAVLGYYLIDNNNKYQDFRLAAIQRADSTDKYVSSPIYGINVSRGSQNIRFARDYYRRNRDLTILLSIGFYGLQIAEAYVHAYLKDFDVSEDLSLRVQPGLMRVPHATGYTPGLTLTLYTTSRPK
ncbi:hypothetical protein I2I11_13770 [Pontibacter sp. 172403-2]|nr:hypothetical protein [Pontibacter sp. 172403-2]